MWKPHPGMVPEFLRRLRRRARDQRPSGQTQFVIDAWKSPDSSALDYFDRAETDEWLRPFWGEGSVFRRLFATLDLERVLEIACGKGRHAAQVVDRCASLTLLDTSPIAIDHCRKRFAGRPNVEIILSATGRDLAPIPDASMTAAYSFDSMVHFEMDVVFAYLAEIHRVLNRGGRALLHHSVYDQRPGGDLRGNAGWRNFMSAPAFRHVAARLGLEVETMEVFAWDSAELTDGLTLLRKP